MDGSRNFISIDDDDFFCQPFVDLERFCQGYKRYINIPFGCHVHINSFNEDKLKLLIDAGLKIVTSGIQSGSDRINREIYNRYVNKSQVLNMANTLWRYRREFLLSPSYHVINCNPYESEADVWETIHLLSSFPKPFNVQMFQLTFSPNTYLTKKSMADGVLSEEKELAFDKHYYDAISYAKRRKKYRYGWFVLNLLVGVHNNRKVGSVSRNILHILSGMRVRRFFERRPFLVRMLCYFLYLNRQYRRYTLPLFLRDYYNRDT